MATKKETSASDGPEIGIGDQVRHAKWGVGTVLFKSGSGEAGKVIVVFPEEGQKKLMLKYAKLKKVGTVPKSEVAAKTKAAGAMKPVVEGEAAAEEPELIPTAVEDTIALPDEVETAAFEEDEEGKFGAKDKDFHE